MWRTQHLTRRVAQPSPQRPAPFPPRTGAYGILDTVNDPGLAERNRVYLVTAVLPTPQGALLVIDVLAWRWPPRIPRIAAAMRWLYEAGAPIAAGTDAGIAPEKPHDVVRHALAMLHLLGFGPAEALRAVTSAAAGVCGLGHRKGRIAPGFDAVILAVDGDPIADPDALQCIRAGYACGTAVPGAGT